MHHNKPALQSGGYILLLLSFREWLTTLGYSANSIPGLCCYVKDFLHYQEQQGKPLLEQLAARDAHAFIAHLQATTGMRTRRSYSAGHLSKYVQALQLFSRYIRSTGKSGVGFTLPRFDAAAKKPTWLTLAEIERLYEVTGDTILGIRDRAMLAVFYGCGLRLHEGANLELKDILTDRRLLHVRKGKGYKERYVPLAEKSYAQVQFYLLVGRPQLLQQTSTAALFIDANKGRQMQKQSLYVRIKQLTKRAKLKKKVGMHTLRHSIATHLLQAGMPLERIQAFLGHSHLDSTQIYTHLKNELL